ncbi:vesicular inhibitory amino acid transporter-like protein [Dinothrombium tinctorium]|uniref:Vesicular inhibitory amino acid transporter n=1 Tax=Dinothrombium tinctorium TaxID=1965070 RepID=A0A3S3P6J9_9ACAR|nr:vesicular inhibitory amino acid transporter-like protein [Dinothrombium tinctorium]RWS06279.1 vesicular inhibitory amino acid transporter-like protein [Dinothrombium tinctorium]
MDKQEILDQMLNAWYTVQEKAKIYCPCFSEGPSESSHINRQGEHEMSSFRSFDAPDYTRQAGEEFQEYDEFEADKVTQMDTGFSEHGVEPGAKISEWQAGWNVTNAIQGMFIVSLPYAVLHGGYWGIFALVFVAYICCYTGKILVASLYEPNEKGEWVRVRDSYVDIAKTVIGEKIGGKMVNTAQIIELLMTCILYVVLCGDLMIGSFHELGIDQRSWMMISAMFLFPCAFLKNLKAVSTLSFWCTVSHIIINVIILGYCLLQIGNWYWSKVTFRFDSSTFPITLGIVVFSYTSQIFLPSLEGSMKDRSRFHCMLDWSHISAAAFKALFAYVGFLTFGDATQEVITNNLPTRGFKMIVNLTLVAKALLSYPLPFYAAAALLESAFFRGKPTDEHPHGEGPQPFPTCWERDGDFRVWAVSLRVLLVLVTLLFAISIPHFAILMGLIGSFTGTMLSFVWPCYFHMRLKWDTLQFSTIVWEVFIICIGVVCGIIGIVTSFNALIDAYHLPLPYAPGKHPTHG